MRIFFVLWASLIVAIIVHMIFYNVLDSTGYLGASTINVPGNSAFSIMLALLLWSGRRAKQLPFATLAGIVAFVVSCIAVVLAAVSVMPRAPLLGVVMTAPVGAIGSYPAGADVSLPEGAIAWGLSVLVPVGAGFFLGLLFQKLSSSRRRPPPRRIRADETDARV